MGVHRDPPGMECLQMLDECGLTPKSSQTTPPMPTIGHSMMMDLLFKKLNALAVQQEAPADTGVACIMDKQSKHSEAESLRRCDDEPTSSKEGIALRRQDAPMILGSLNFHFGPSGGCCFPLVRQLAPLGLTGLGGVPLARQFAPLNLGVSASAALHLTRQCAPMILGGMSSLD